MLPIRQPSEAATYKYCSYRRLDTSNEHPSQHKYCRSRAPEVDLLQRWHTRVSGQCSCGLSDTWAGSGIKSGERGSRGKNMARVRRRWQSTSLFSVASKLKCLHSQAGISPIDLPQQGPKVDHKEIKNVGRDRNQMRSRRRKRKQVHFARL